VQCANGLHFTVSVAWCKPVFDLQALALVSPMLLDSDRLAAQADEFRDALRAGELVLAGRRASRVSPGRMGHILMELTIDTALVFLQQRGWHRSAPVLAAIPLE